MSVMSNNSLFAYTKSLLQVFADSRQHLLKYIVTYMFIVTLTNLNANVSCGLIAYADFTNSGQEHVDVLW